MKQNSMILNGVNLGINKIELNECDLLITDKFCKYCLKVCIKYNWKEMNRLKIGEAKNIDFNEYCFSENNEAALIFPSKCHVEKISDDSIYFNFEFNDLPNTVHYMNKRGHFDIDLDTLEVKVLINYKDVKGDSIVYKFNV